MDEQCIKRLEVEVGSLVSSNQYMLREIQEILMAMNASLNQMVSDSNHN